MKYSQLIQLGTVATLLFIVYFIFSIDNTTPPLIIATASNPIISQNESISFDTLNKTLPDNILKEIQFFSVGGGWGGDPEIAINCEDHFIGNNNRSILRGSDIDIVFCGPFTSESNAQLIKPDNTQVTLLPFLNEGEYWVMQYPTPATVFSYIVEHNDPYGNYRFLIELVEPNGSFKHFEFDFEIVKGPPKFTFLRKGEILSLYDFYPMENVIVILYEICDNDCFLKNVEGYEFIGFKKFQTDENGGLDISISDIGYDYFRYKIVVIGEKSFEVFSPMQTSAISTYQGDLNLDIPISSYLRHREAHSWRLPTNARQIDVHIEFGEFAGLIVTVVDSQDNIIYSGQGEVNKNGKGATLDVTHLNVSDSPPYSLIIEPVPSPYIGHTVNHKYIVEILGID